MIGLRAVALALALALLGAGAAGAQAPPSPDVQRLSAALAELDADPALLGKAALERYQAQQAVATLRSARSRDREHALWLAEAYVAAARDAAQAEALAEQSRQLDRDRDQLLLEASRQQADAAWREADRLRQAALAREEEAARLAVVQEQERLANEQLAAEADAANAQASQAMKLADARAREIELARQQAELAAALEAEEGSNSAPPMRRVGNRRIYTLPGTAFASGSDRISPAAVGSLRALAADLAGKRVRVEAHTDSQGGDAANLALSQKRAAAVREALAAAGVPAARITAVGKGETDPVTDNGSAEGRARNRRVEISVE
jgi:outer membrane protein OmpA-like peptidoglycan-associated protein